MLTNITYFNIVVGIIYLSVVLTGAGYLSGQDYAFVIFLMLVMFYNWTGIRKLKGQTIKWKRTAVVAGVFVFLFGAILIASGINMFIKAGDLSKSIAAVLFIAVTDIVFGAMIVYQVIRSVRLFAK